MLKRKLKRFEEKRGGGTNPEMSSAHPETQLNPKVESSIKPSEKNTSDVFTLKKAPYFNETAGKRARNFKVLF